MDERLKAMLEKANENYTNAAEIALKIANCGARMDLKDGGAE